MDIEILEATMFASQSLKLRCLKATMSRTRMNRFKENITRRITRGRNCNREMDAVWSGSWGKPPCCVVLRYFLFSFIKTMLFGGISPKMVAWQSTWFSVSSELPFAILICIEGAAFRHFESFWVLFLQSWLRSVFSILAIYIIGAMDVVCAENADKKLMSTFLLNQNFACQIEMIYISLVNLHFTEMTLISRT